MPGYSLHFFLLKYVKTVSRIIEGVILIVIVNADFSVVRCCVVPSWRVKGPVCSCELRSVKPTDEVAVAAVIFC